MTVSFHGWATMIDGKCLGYITGVTALQSCPLRGATLTEMSIKSSEFVLKDNEDILKHGLSPLHCKIRALKFLLHLGLHSEDKESRIQTGTEQAANRDA